MNYGTSRTSTIDYFNTSTNSGLTKRYDKLSGDDIKSKLILQSSYFFKLRENVFPDLPLQVSTSWEVCFK